MKGGRSGFLSFREEYIAIRRRGGGNVGIGFIDFQGLWEGRKTRTIVFRAFHKPPFPRPLPLRHASYADFLICSNIAFLACCLRRAASVSLMDAATRISAAMESPGLRNRCGRSSESGFSSGRKKSLDLDQTQLLCSKHADRPSSACPLQSLQAHLALESTPAFRLILRWIRVLLASCAISAYYQFCL